MNVSYRGRGHGILLIQVGSRLECTEQEIVSYLEIMGICGRRMFFYQGWEWEGVDEGVFFVYVYFLAFNYISCTLISLSLIQLSLVSIFACLLTV